MMGRDWSDRRKVQQERTSSGYTHLRVSRATHAKVQELLKQLGYSCSGADELVFELTAHVLADPARLRKIR